MNHYLKIAETCPVCGRVERNLYFRTNDPQKFKELWLEHPTGRKIKCHKKPVELKVHEGDAVLEEIDKLTYIERKNYLGTMNF